MNSVLKLLVVILIASPLTVNLSDAWNSGTNHTHEHIAAKLYSDMPANIQKNLDISEMKKGANYPDTLDVGHKELHAYPLSVNKTEENLKAAMTDFKNARNAKTTTERTKYYKQESFHLGMATHYISDTFAAPHCIYRMENYHDYYKIADGITDMKGTTLPQNVTRNLKSHEGLDTLLKYGHDEGRKDAQYWNENQIWKDQTKSKSLVTKNLKRAYAGTLAVFEQWLGFTANPVPPMRAMRAIRGMRT
jgi:hypothetical protein